MKTWAGRWEEIALKDICYHTAIVITSAVLSLFSSSSIELSDENERLKFLDCTIGSSSSWKVRVKTN